MLAFALIYAIVYIKESPLSLEEAQQKDSAKRSVLKQFFDYHQVIQVFRVIFGDGPDRRRLRIVLLLVVWIIVAGPTQGTLKLFQPIVLLTVYSYVFCYLAEGAILYFFTRVQFSWTEVELSYFSTYNIVTTFLGTYPKYDKCIFIPY